MFYFVSACHMFIYATLSFCFYILTQKSDCVVYIIPFREYICSLSLSYHLYDVAYVVALRSLANPNAN